MSSVEPGCSAVSTHQATDKHPPRQEIRTEGSPSHTHRKKMVRLHMEKLARDLHLIGERKSVWALLPIHLLVRILRLLPLLDRGRCSLICKRWNAVCHMPDLWHKFTFEFMQGTLISSSTQESLIKQVFEKHSGDLRHVTIKVDGNQQSAEAACDVLSQLGDCTLQTLQLKLPARPSFASMEPQKVVTALMRIFTKSALRLLAVEEMPMDDALLERLSGKSQATLASLRINSCPSVTAEGLSKALASCEHLCELSVDYSHLSDALLEALCTPSHVALRDLSANVVETDSQSSADAIPWQPVSSASWDLLMTHSPNLAFSLQFRALREEHYSHFFHCKMPVTALHFNCFVPRTVLHCVPATCPRLRELSISNSGDEAINEAILDIGMRCGELRAVELGSCLVTCAAVVQLAKMCGPRLTRLVVHEEMVLEDEECNIETMSREVSHFLQRQWDVEFIPTWFE